MIKKFYWPSFWISKFYEPPAWGTNLSAINRNRDLCPATGLRLPDYNINILAGFPQ
jgi:hypothetical protein